MHVCFYCVRFSFSVLSQPHLALFFVYFVYVKSVKHASLRMHVCFYFVRFSFSVLSQEISWEECFQNYLVCVRWDVKPQLSTMYAVK